MTDKNTIKATCTQGLSQTFSGIESPAPDRRGKVRELYESANEILLVTSDRVSAFDVQIGTIPYKGAMLAEQAAFWLDKAKAICPTHLIDRPEPEILRCKLLETVELEVIVRGYLAGSLAREDAATRGNAYGLRLDPNILPNTAFDTPIVTPTTKAAVGDHDEPISMENAVAAGLVSTSEGEQLAEIALALFASGQAFAKKQGLILVDTKYEFGRSDAGLVLIDEAHTADSSRFWWAEDYDERLASGTAPKMLDKERLRSWLRDQGFSGEGEVPDLPDEVRVDLAAHYWELTEMLTGHDFVAPKKPLAERLPRAVEKWQKSI